jgi:hypothetical protein
MNTMKKLITETVDVHCFDDDGCTYKEYIHFTYPVDSFVFICKFMVRKKKESYDNLYDRQTSDY